MLKRIDVYQPVCLFQLQLLVLWVDAFGKQAFVFLSLGSGFCKGEIWVFSQTEVGSFFGVRTGVIEQLKLGAVGLHSKIQSVPVSEVISLFFRFGLLNLSVSEGLDGIGHAASFIFPDVTICVTSNSGCYKTSAYSNVQRILCVLRYSAGLRIDTGIIRY